MQNRVLKIIGKNSLGLSWLGTFHSISVKFLRKHAKAVGLNYNFTILDQDDQTRLLNICKAENIDIKKISANYILSVIDKWKNKGLYPEDVNIKKSDFLESQFLNIQNLPNKINRLKSTLVICCFIVLNYLRKTKILQNLFKKLQVHTS